MFYQIPLQIIVLLMATTETATTGGFESFFMKDSFFGIKAGPDQVLLASVILCVMSAISNHVKAMITEKGILRIKPKLTIFMWTLCAVVRRIMAIVIFLTPSLGLGNILYHWKAEAYPFKFRVNSVKRLNLAPSPMSKIELFNMTETVYWSEYDRWDYSDPQHPAPPSYDVYTGKKLKISFALLFVILILHTFSMLLVKFRTSEDFREKKRHAYEKFLHLLECVNFPVPYRDWDEGGHSVAESRRRYSNTEREMIGSFAVSIFFTLVMVAPLFYTGIKNI